MFRSVLRYKRLQYLKIAAVVCCLAFAGYFFGQRPWADDISFWADYGLGVATGGMTLWLAWYGIRRRRYNGSRGSLSAWLSAHIYLGLAAIVFAGLHAGIDFDLNVHTATFLLFLFTCASGVVGTVLTVSVPARLAQTEDGRTFDGMIQKIADVNRELRALAAPLDDDSNRLVRRSVQYTVVSGNFWQRLTGRYKDTFMEDALEGLRRAAEGGRDSSAVAREAVVLLARKADLLTAARRHVQLQTWLLAWKFIHIPTTVALIGALFIHVFAVHYYW